MEEKTRILAILPYEGMREQIQRVAEKFRQLEVDIIVSDLEHAASAGRRALKRKNYDIIIARGGMAERLRSEVKEIEIAEIQVDFSDVFRSLIMARNYNEKFAIQSFPAIADSARKLCSMMQYDIDVYEIHSPEESREQLIRLKEQGYTMVVGDVTTSAMAQEVGMNVILIMNGDDSIRAVLEQVIVLENVKRKARKEARFLKAVGEGVPGYLAIFDRDGNRVYSNDDSGKRFPEIANYTEKNKKKFLSEDDYHEDVRLRRKLFVLQSEKTDLEGTGPVSVVFGRQLSEYGDENSGIAMVDEEPDAGYAFKSYFGVANVVGEAREAILRYCNARDPILILGETGCGKDQAAASIHRMGYNKNRPYYMIDCAFVSNKEWSRFFRQSSSPLMEVNCTIYFKNLQAMNPAQEKKLIELIQTTNLCRRNQVIFSAIVKNEDEICTMAKYLMERTACILLQAMPLRKRREDIVSICTMYLTEISTQDGTQIFGLDREACKAVEEYSWPGNVTQLKRVLKEAVMMTEDGYITADMISRCIYNEAFEHQDVHADHIDLNQSLDDITYDLVRMVLKEEGMNRQKTADRLKISRTTLWRILKSRGDEEGVSQ